MNANRARAGGTEAGGVDGRRVDVLGHALRVVTSGVGERHFLCLHGLVDTLEVFDRLAPALEARGRVCRFDQRGHGASDAPPGPYARADLARDVLGVLDLEGVKRTVLVGHSLGGIVALETALTCPDRVAGLVLIGTASECRQEVARWYERIARAGETDGNAGLCRAIYGEASRKRIVGDAQGLAHVARMLTSLHDDPLTAKLTRLRCPVLLLVGENDPMGPRASEIVHDAIPPRFAKLVQIPDRGHWLQLDATSRVAAEIDAWLDESNA
jgi:pimeloyl-ACP methyl ester carboxylesterase